MSVDYKNETYLIYKQKTDELLTTLPPFCTKARNERSLRLTEKTQYDYAYKMSIFLNYLHENNSYFKYKDIKDTTIEDLGLLTKDDAVEFISWVLKRHCNEKNGKLNKKTTANVYIATISSYYKLFISDNLLTYNPFSGIDREKRHEKDIIYMKESQIDDFLNAVCAGEGLTAKEKVFHEKNSIRDICMCCLLLDTGMRVSELVGLDLDDIDFKECCIYIQRKGNKPDTVFFSDKMKNILEEYLEFRKTMYPTDDNRAVFVVTIGRYQGDRISVRSVERTVKKYAKASNIPQFSKITPHKLRSTYAMSMLDETGNIALLKEQLGHESITTSSLYARAKDSDKKAKRNALDIL